MIRFTARGEEGKYVPETRQDGDDNNERDTDDNLEPSYLATLLKKLALAYLKAPDRVGKLQAEAAEGDESDILLMLTLII